MREHDFHEPDYLQQRAADHALRMALFGDPEVLEVTDYVGDSICRRAAVEDWVVLMRSKALARRDQIAKANAEDRVEHCRAWLNGRPWVDVHGDDSYFRLFAAVADTGIKVRATICHKGHWRWWSFEDDRNSRRFEAEGHVAYDLDKAKTEALDELALHLVSRCLDLDGEGGRRRTSPSGPDRR